MEPDFEDKAALFSQLKSLHDVDDDNDHLDVEEVEHRARCKAFAQIASKRVGNGLGSTLKGISNPLGVAYGRTASESTVAAAEQAKAVRPEVVIIEDTPQQPRNLRPRQRRVPSIVNSASNMDGTLIPDSARKLASQPDTRAPQPQEQRTIRSSPSLAADSPFANMAKRKRNDKLNMVPGARRYFSDMNFFFYPNNDINAARKRRIDTARKHGANWVRKIDDATHMIVDAGLNYADIEQVIANYPGSGNKVIVNERWPGDCISSDMILNTATERFRVPGHPQASKIITKAQHQYQGYDQSLKVKEPTSRARKAQTALATTPPRSDASTHRSAHSSFHETLLSSQQGSQQKALGIVDTKSNSTIKVDSVKPVNATTVETNKRLADNEWSQFVQYCMENPEVDVDGDDGVEVDIKPLSSRVGSSVAAFPTWSAEKESSEEESKQTKKRKSKGKSPKTNNWQDNFACMVGAAPKGSSYNPNAKAIAILQQLADHWASNITADDDKFRTNNYRKAANSLRRRTTIVTTAEEAREIPGVGEKIAEKIGEIAQTGRCRELEELRKDPSNVPRELFLKIYGVGHTTANDWIKQGFRTLQDVLDRGRPNKNQRVGIAHFDDLNTRIPRVEVTALGDCVMRTARTIDPQVKFIIGGSYRRGQLTSGDIDFIVTKTGTTTTADLDPFFRKLIKKLTKEGFLTAGLASSRSEDGNKWQGCCVLPEDDFPGDKANYKPVWRRIDFLLVPDTELGAAMTYFTGNDLLNRSMRLLANKKGFNLSHKGLFQGVIRDSDRKKVNDGVLVEARDERKIWDIIGVPWLEPHERNI